MRKVILVLFSACVFLGALAAQAQDDAPSLGDAARQARLQKQQKEAQAAKDAQSTGSAAKDAQTPDVQGKDVQDKDAQGKDIQSKDAAKNTESLKPKKVITNDEIPEHIGPTSTLKPVSQPQGGIYPQPAGNNQAAADQWKARILQMKSSIASVETQISNLEHSVQYAGGNCISGCVQWNERQQQKQEQAEVMKQQLEQQKKQMEQMQEMARRQGFGSSVYDP
jgi:hypothetical protein